MKTFVWMLLWWTLPISAMANETIRVDFGPTLAEGWASSATAFKPSGRIESITTAGHPVTSDGLGGIRELRIRLPKGEWHVALWTQQPVVMGPLAGILKVQFNDQDVSPTQADTPRAWFDSIYLNKDAPYQPTVQFKFTSTGRAEYLTFDQSEGIGSFVSAIAASRDATQIEQITQSLPAKTEAEAPVYFTEFTDADEPALIDQWYFYELPAVDYERPISWKAFDLQAKVWVTDSIHEGQPNRLRPVARVIPPHQRAVIALRLNRNVDYGQFELIEDARGHKWTKNLTPVNAPTARVPNLGVFYGPDPMLVQLNLDWRTQVRCDFDLLTDFGLRAIAPGAGSKALEVSQMAANAGLTAPTPLYQRTDGVLKTQGLLFPVTEQNGVIDAYTSIEQIQETRQQNPGIELVGFLSHRDDFELARALDLAFLSDDWGLTPERLRRLDADNVGLYNLPAPRFYSGVFAAKHQIQHGLYWHARKPKGHPFDPADGADVHWIYPDSRCDAPVIHAKLLKLTQARGDHLLYQLSQRYQLWSQAPMRFADQQTERDLHRWQINALKEIHALLSDS